MADDTTTVLDYLEHLVVAGMSDRTSRSTDVAGRVVAVLLEALVTAGGASRATGYLAPDPGGDCTLEVFAPDAAAEHVGLDELFDRLADTDAQPGTVVVASDARTLRRQVLEVGDDGAMVFVFPDADRIEGPLPALDEARRRWAWTVTTWTHRSLGAPAAPLRGVSTDTSTAELVDAVRDVLAEEAARHDDSVVERVTAAVPHPPEFDLDALAARLAGAVPQPTPIDTDALATRLAAAVPQPTPLDTDALATRLAGAVPQSPPIDVDALATRLAAAVPQPTPLDTDALATRLAAAVPQPTPLDTDALATRLAAAVPQPTPLDVDALATRLQASQPALDTDALVRRLAESVPRPDTLDTFALVADLAAAVPPPTRVDVDGLAERLATAVPPTPGLDVDDLTRRITAAVPAPLPALDVDDLTRRITAAVPAPPPLDVDALVGRLRQAAPAPPPPLDVDDLTRRITAALPAPPPGLDVDALVDRIARSAPTPAPAPLDVDALVRRLAGATPSPAPALDVDELARRITAAMPAAPAASAPVGAPAPIDVDALLDRLRRESAADVGDAVRTALSEVALEVDLGAIDTAVADAVGHALAGREAAPAGDSEMLVARLTGALRPEPLDVERLADLLGERLPTPVVHLDEGEAEIRRLATQVVETLRPFLEAIGSSGQGTAMAEAALVSTSEQLHVQLQAFSDRISAGSRSLTALADEMAASTREANAYADRVAESLSASVDRLGRQLERRLNELQTGDLGARHARNGLPGGAGHDVVDAQVSDHGGAGTPSTA